ncbi:hypothetical protein [Thermogymnomonas acidicola]|uniref:hypothetical protein n=1 Tax=Thermogymnomonas acidicola TaxID=399579 RepID=UPI0009464808|nr:hypothetical protein [Thermogymnomonas acidicola]
MTVHGNSINVNYTVTSQVPLRYVNITVGNRILRARAPSGNLEFEAPSNGGVYRVRIVAFADNGLNSSYNSSVTVLFYPPELGSISLSSTDTWLGIWVHIVGRGNLSLLNITWFVGGSKAGDGTGIVEGLLPGSIQSRPGFRTGAGPWN